MAQAGFPIPPGFVVTSGAYYKHLDANGLREPLSAILDTLDVDDSDKLNEASEKIKKLITDAKMPETSATQSSQATKGCAERSLKRFTLQSAVPQPRGRFGRPHSFAGQQSTYLNVKGTESVVGEREDVLGFVIRAASHLLQGAEQV